jgi:hypothetical protein
MASIARGLETGINLGFRFDQALREKERRDALRAATEDKSFAKYSPEQGAQMRAEADMVDELGRPKYQYSIEPGSTTYTRREITYPGAPTVTEGMSYGGPMYEEAAAPAPRSREEIARSYRVPFDSSRLREVGAAASYAGPVQIDLNGEPIYYPPEGVAEGVAMGDDAGRGLTARDTGISRPANTVSPRPEDSAAYGRLMRQLGAPTTMAAPELTEYLGQTVKGGLGKEQQRSMLLDRYADIISKDDPVEGMKLRAMALQEKIGSYQLKQIERGEKQDIAEDKFLEAVKADQSIMQGDWATAAAKYGIRPERFIKIAEGVLGLEKGKIQQMTMAVEKAYRNSKGNLNTFLQSTLDDYDYDPTSHMVARKGPNGGVIIDVVETVAGKDGKTKQAGKVISSLPEQANELEALDTAYAVLASPGQAAQTALKNQKTREELAYMRKHGNYFESVGEAYRSGARGGLGKNAFEIVGFDKDNTPILFNKNTGNVGRQDSKPIQDADFVKKFAGAGAAAISRQEEIAYKEMLNSDAWERAKTDADKAKVMRKYNLDPAKFGMTGIPGGGWND